MRTTRLLPLAAALLLAAGCGGGATAPSTPVHAVGVTVVGLLGHGLTLHLGPATPGEDLPVAADGTTRFAGGLAEGAAWAVAVKVQPTAPWQDCAVDGAASGAMGAADAAVTVRCTTRAFPVGGTVSGLLGDGLSLRLNGGAALAVAADGAFTFPGTLPSGADYLVTVATHPASPRQACAVTAATGQGTVQDQPVTGVRVTCRSDVHLVGGAVAGRTGDGLRLHLEVGGAAWADDLPVSSTSFAFPAPVPEGSTWAVTVGAQPTAPWQTCAVAGGTGTMGTADVASVSITCTTNAYPVRAQVAGLLRPGLTLRLTAGGVAGDPLPVGADGAHDFPLAAASGASILVAVVDQPPTQACAVTAPAEVVDGSAVMAGAPLDVTVTCGCAAGLGNCDGLPGNGCEHDVTGDVANCGGCGAAFACAYAHAGAACVAGACQPGSCDPGYASCDGSDATGCEQDIASSTANCGACGRACNLAHVVTQACASGQCAVAPGSCAAGFANCDGNAANGCEQDTLTSVANCGGCGLACNLSHVVTQSCAGGQCAVKPGSCAADFANCDGQDANGCESALSSDPSNCGRCGNQCTPANAPAACAAKACDHGTCNPGWADCDGNRANGCESPVDHDVNNCGACGNVCSSTHGTPSCLASACAMSACDAGWGDCRGAAVPGCETNLTSDRQDCGSCGHVCAAGQICGGGSCLAPPSCAAILADFPATFGVDGTYAIDPSGSGTPIQVFCDMTTDGGGWTFFAHVNGDYQAGTLFEADTGTWDPLRGDGNATYGRGASVYRKIGATELMISVGNKSPIAATAYPVFYTFPPGHRSFTTGPVPCDPTDPSFQYRTLLGTYSGGLFGVCDVTEWKPYTGDFLGGGEPLVMLSGSFTLGTLLGSGVDPLLNKGDSSAGWDSWWYAR